MYENSFSFEITHAKYIIRLYVLAEVHEVRVLEVHDGIQEGCDRLMKHYNNTCRGPLGQGCGSL